MVDFYFRHETTNMDNTNHSKAKNKETAAKRYRPALRRAYKCRSLYIQSGPKAGIHLKVCKYVSNLYMIIL